MHTQLFFKKTSNSAGQGRGNSASETKGDVVQVHVRLHLLRDRVGRVDPAVKLDRHLEDFRPLADLVCGSYFLQCPMC